MSQHDYVIDNQNGADTRTDLNNAFAAIVSNNSGSTEPTTTFAYMWWSDTTTGLLKIRNAADSAWVTVGTLADLNLGLLALAGGTMTGDLVMTAASIDHAKGSNIASATTTNIGAATGNLVHITGTNNITGFDNVQAGITRIVIFDGILTLTDSGTLILNNDGDDIVTSAGSMAICFSEGSGTWRVWFFRLDGLPHKESDSFIISVSDEFTALTTGTAKVTFRMPHGFTLTDVRASLTVASTSGDVVVDVNEDGVSILSTKITVDQDEKTSETGSPAVVISDAVLADDAEITVDIDSAGTGAKGLKVYLIGVKSN